MRTERAGTERKRGSRGRRSGGECGFEKKVLTATGRKETRPTHQASLGQVTTEPSGLTVFPGGTRQDLPSALKVVPLGQRQVPPWHVEPPRQAAPHAPQLAPDVARLVHAPEQHETATSALHAAPQEPQF